MYNNDQSSTPAAEPPVKADHNPGVNPIAKLEPALSDSVVGEASSATITEGPPLKEAEEQLHAKPQEEEEGTDDAEEEEEEEEESVEDICYALQEDEETRNYMPDFIKKKLENPPVPPGISVKFFNDVFVSVAASMEPHRPKTDLEFFAVSSATSAIVRLTWLDDLSPAVVNDNQREAVEALDHKLRAVVPSSKKEKDDYDRDSKEVAMDYFADPNHRNEFQARLENGGFGATAVVTEAFQRALPSLQKIEAMRKFAIKERDQALKELERAYSLRDPEQRMPLSIAARRNFYDELREEKRLEREERLLEQAKKLAQNGDA